MLTVKVGPNQYIMIIVYNYNKAILCYNNGKAILLKKISYIAHSRWLYPYNYRGFLRGMFVPVVKYEKLFLREMV